MAATTQDPKKAPTGKLNIFGLIAGAIRKMIEAGPAMARSPWQRRRPMRNCQPTKNARYYEKQKEGRRRRTRMARRSRRINQLRAS